MGLDDLFPGTEGIDWDDPELRARRAKRRKQIEARPTLDELQARRQRKIERLVEQHREDPQKPAPKAFKVKNSPRKPGQIPIPRRES